jgi:multidrug efflux pump subunit AcrB
MMMDFAHNEGKTPAAAIHQACPLRFRPILMTKRAPVLGALVLMISTDIRSQLHHPLGLVGDRLVSLVLTLSTMPMIYLWFNRPQRRHFNMDVAVRATERRSAEQGSPAG